MSLMCITNQMNDTRSCTIKDEHRIVCDHWQYRWNDTHNRLEATGRECTGCLPVKAKQGHLCWNCWDNARDALGGYPHLQLMLTGIDRAVQADNVGVRGQSLGYIPIPGVPLTLEELQSYRRDAPASLTDWVSSPEGAKNAVRFARAYRAAMRAHPTEEVAHKIRRTRCTSCSQLSLLWKPPSHFGDNVTVTCSNPECLAELDQASFEKIAAIEKPGLTGSAVLAGEWIPNQKNEELFDPTNPIHAQLIA